VDKLTELAEYSVTDEALAQYRKEFLPLTINGIEDKEGYEKVKTARLFVKGERVNVEKKRVELKQSALDYGRAVDAEAKRITTAIEEVENHLIAEQKKIDDEVARIKFEKEQRAVLPERIAKLAELDATMSEEELLKMDGTQFMTVLNGFLSAKLEKQRLAQEETERKQREEQERIEAEKKAIEDKKLDAEREARHQAEIEEAKKKAAEDERIAAEAEAKAAAERIEAERPDNEKLEAFAWSLSTMQMPEVSSKRAKAKVARARKVLDELVVELKAA
jgi:hypothetical protein